MSSVCWYFGCDTFGFIFLLIESLPPWFEKNIRITAGMNNVCTLYPMLNKAKEKRKSRFYSKIHILRDLWEYLKLNRKQFATPSFSPQLLYILWLGRIVINSMANKKSFVCFGIAFSDPDKFHCALQSLPYVSKKIPVEWANRLWVFIEFVSREWK